MYPQQVADEVHSETLEAEADGLIECELCAIVSVHVEGKQTGD